jgi:hypothetical protein
LVTPPHKILQIATVLSAVGSAQGSVQAAQAPVELPTLGKLIGQLRQDATLRARFSLDPRSVLVETGIDPNQYNLPDRLDENEVHRFLDNWAGARGPAAGSLSASAVTSSGDRSGSLLTQANEHLEKLASQAAPTTSKNPNASGEEEKIPVTKPPPTPVYGPPAGFPPKPPEPVAPPSPAPPGVIYGPPPGLPPAKP